MISKKERQCGRLTTSRFIQYGYPANVFSQDFFGAFSVKLGRIVIHKNNGDFYVFCKVSIIFVAFVNTVANNN